MLICFYRFRLPKEQTNTASSRHKAQINFNENKDFHFPIIRKQLNRNCELPILFRKSIGSITINASNLFVERDEGQKIQKYVEHLMPLLFETWIEVRPSKINLSKSSADMDDDEEICISNEAAFTLKITVEIFEQLFELMQMCDHDVNGSELIDWFRRKYNNEFVTQFLIGFPYHQSDGFKGKNKIHEYF